MRTALSRTARIVAAVVGALVALALLPGASAAVVAPATFAAQHAPGPDRQVPAAAPVDHDPTRPTAVVVLGEQGAVVSDVLAPYEILAATGRFNVYAVAAHRRPVPLTGGLDLVPDVTFDELAARLDGAAPELVVVPALPDVGEPSTAVLTTWLRAQHDRGSLLLSVCNGAGVLASAGLLDGRPATAHWLRLATFESRYPQVAWVHGQRFVDDGDVVTTAGILSGVDGTLHVVERLAGPSVAADAAAAIRWRHYPADLPVTDRGGVGPVAILNAGYRWNPPSIGVALTDGVGEIELASVFDVHGGQSLAARTLAVSADGAAVRSRHGLTFLPRADLAGAAPQLDRLLVPGAGTVAQVPGGPTPEDVHDEQGFAYDAAVRDVARTADVATARWAAKVLELPTDGLELAGPAWPWGPTGTLVALFLPGAVAVAVAGVRGRRARTAR